MTFFWSSARNLISTMPGGSRMPPRDSASAYISIRRGLMVGSITTHAPPRSSPFGGMYTKTGMSCSRSASTIMAPNLSTSSYMSRVPPLKPRQFAKTMTGKRSPLKSRMACAVLKAESGYQTWPACMRTFSRLSGSAGSAGTRFSMARVSTAITPMGMPPSVARPATTLLPQPPRYSVKLPASKKPGMNEPSAPVVPASILRGSYAVLVGVKAMSRSGESATVMREGIDFMSFGTKLSHCKILATPSSSSSASWCETPFGYMICGPPS
mmetsp:Transcript_30542/g.53706  ORF Transcript_30542/g.53706 Transcript_30542/m.53706 type:complete len:268 (-) Transcript_30542:1971-2774(-)